MFARAARASLVWQNYGRLDRCSSSDGELRWFGQMRREGREWHAEIRDHETGNMIRYAGIWKRRQDAKDEIEYLLSTPEAK